MRTQELQMPNSIKYFFLAGLLLVSCFTDQSTEPISPEKPELNPVEKSVVQAENDFGIRLFQKIVGATPDTNIFISPLSVSMALGMTLNGANGTTWQAMQSTLGFEGLTNQQINEAYQNLLQILSGLDPKVQFQIANSIWYRQGFTFDPEFIKLNQTYFDAEVAGLDFSQPAAASTMNQWIEDKTNGRIKNMIQPPINPFTIMFLINAIYFKGTWTYQFDETKTRDDYFYADDESRQPCRIMVQRSKYFYFENDAFQAIDLPYGDGDFITTIFLPTGENKLDQLIAELTPEKFQNWLTNFKADSVSLFLPRFKLEYKIKLNDVLSALGMEAAFTDAADFTKMYPPGGVFISQVLHKSFLEVNEEGTEAAAATVVEMALTSIGGGPKQIIMNINRPFLFIIRDRITNTILFVGKIMNPGSSAE
jgi:serpin B